MQHKIRPASKYDLPAIKSIDKQLFGSESYPSFVLRQLLDLCGSLFKVAVVEDSIKGYAIAQFDATTKRAWFLSLGVLANYQGQGIGRALLSQLLHEVELNGAEMMYLTVMPDNIKAIDLYSSLGFERLTIENDYYGDGAPRLVMVKTLK